MQNSHQTPKPAATVILARDTENGLEVFMMKRTTNVAFAKGMHVFPGGSVDETDHSEEMHALCHGLDDTLASRQLGIEKGGLSYWVAAVRECFEEAGLFLGYASGLHSFEHTESKTDRLAMHRAALAENELSFVQMLQVENLKVAADQLIYYSHWVTQPGRPRRYDTRFFVAQAPSGQIAMHDNSETVAHLWVRPSEALDLHKRGELDLMFPTIKTLESMTHFHRVQDLLAYARSKPQIPLMAPRSSVAKDGSIRLLIPSDYAFAEVAKLDPHDKGTAKSDIEPGHPVKLATDIWRLTAPNPGMMTGPGTNTYLIGNSKSGIAVIDPGPALDEHIEAILQLAEGPIKWILCTHTHRDHSPAAKVLKSMTGAQLIGMSAPMHAGQDQEFVPDLTPRHREVLRIAGTHLRAIHTPGHASNHFCYLHEIEKIMFTGDHIMQGSTVVINPPDGDMQVYLESLKMIANESMEYLAPGHGFLIGKPVEAIERLLIHRLDRENKVISALKGSNQPQSIEQLVAMVYQDTPPQRHAMAMRSLLAHLLKLKHEGRTIQNPDGWILTAGN
ncbi:MAG TPA: hypothetical protein DDY24_01980 [Alcaligenaceae bacterium]|nr:hypothetical protein [Alcaligenaceae bacterium]